MKINETESWYEVRDGQYFCKDCNEPLVGQTMREAFVLDAPVIASYHHCSKCLKNVMLPPSPR
jgi:hypothetical protein